MQIRLNPCLETLSSSVGSSASFEMSTPNTPLSVASFSPSFSSTTPDADTQIHETPFEFQMSGEVPDKRYTIELMSSADSEEVIVFLRTFFFKDEPLNQSLNLGDCPELEQWAAKYLRENCSFKAINTKGEIIGVIINGLLVKDAEEAVPEDVCRHKQFNAILEMIQYVATQFNLFEHYPQFQRALEGKIMSVNGAYRGAGIAKELTRRTIEYMISQDVHLFHVMCTSHFSALVCDRLGMNEIYTLNYLDYVVNGRHPLQPAKPHGYCRLYGMIV